MITEKKVKTEYVAGARKEVAIQGRWWAESDTEAGVNAYLVAQQIKENQSGRAGNNLRYARLYKNLEMLGLQAGTYSRATAGQALESRVTFNVIRQCIDTACNKIAKNRPRPIFLTSGGDYQMKKKAKNLTKFCDGLFDLGKVYKKAQKVFTDAMVFGLGVMHVYQEYGAIKFERVMPDEILVDEMEGIYGEPRQMHRMKYLHRDVMLHLFGANKDLRQIILDAPAGMKGDDASKFAGDLIAVVESWHLKSGPNAQDGKRCLSIQGATLLVEKYERDTVPFVFFRWAEDLIGFYGTGLAEELQGIQAEINKILKNIQKAISKVAVPRVYIENGSSINQAHITNEVGGIVKYTGKAPIFDTATGMNAEVYNHLDRLYNKAFELAGISQLAAASKKPAGLNAAVALREFNDIESERFAVVGQNWEAFFMEIAACAIEIGQDLFSKGINLKINVPGKKFIEKMKWSEVSLEQDSYVLRCFPASLLPTQPAGRLEMVQELIQGGFLDKSEGLSLLDFPDLEKTLSLKNASMDDLVEQLEGIVEGKIYSTPEPYQNLKLGVSLGQSMYLKARSNGVGPEELELLRRFIDDCESMLKEAASAEPVPAQAAVSDLAPAQPAAVPVSDLLPIGHNFKTVV